LTLTIINDNLSGNYRMDRQNTYTAMEGAISLEKPKDVLNINELASYLNIPKSTIYKLVQEGKISAQSGASLAVSQGDHRFLARKP
jgi:plasmid maintenance system antidote protein VapI